MRRRGDRPPDAPRPLGRPSAKVYVPLAVTIIAAASGARAMTPSGPRLRARQGELWLETSTGAVRVVDLRLEEVRDHAPLLRAHGLYERVLVEAYTRTHYWPPEATRRLFEQADPARLRAAGEPLPGPGPFVLYRGVAGTDPERWARGLSWTRSLRVAPEFGSTVYHTTVSADDVAVYWNWKEEEEFVLLLLPCSTISALAIPGKSTQSILCRHVARPRRLECPGIAVSQ